MVGPLVHWVCALASMHLKPPGCELDNPAGTPFWAVISDPCRNSGSFLFRSKTHTGTPLEMYQEDKIGCDDS